MKTKYKITGLILFFLLMLSCQKNKNVIQNKNSTLALLKKIDHSISKDIEKEKILDSLSLSVLVENNDSVQRNLLFKISNKYYHLNKEEKYFDLVNKTYVLSLENKDTSHIAKSLCYIGDYYNRISRYDSAYSYYNKSEKLYITQKDTLMIGMVLLLKGGVFFETGNYAESETETIKAVRLLSKTKRKDLVYNCYNLIAVSLKGLNNYKEALEYYNLTLTQLNVLENENYPKEDIIKLRIACYNNIGRVYEKMENYPEAIRYYYRGLEFKNIKNDYPKKYAILIDNLAYSKMKSGDFVSVLDMLNESFELTHRLGLKTETASNKINFGHYYFLKKDTVKALAAVKEGLMLSKEIKNSELTLLSLKFLSENDNKNRKYYTDLYIKISDSMQNVERITRNKFARIAYETDKIEKKNLVLSKENTNIIIGSGIILFILGVFFIIYRLNIKNKELVFIQEQQEANEKIYQLMLGEQSKTEQARNEERNRIAMELHDGIVNSIFTTRFNLIQLESTAADKKQQLVKELENAENEIRRVSHDLKQNLLFEDKTVPEMMKNLVFAQQNEYQTEFDLSIDKYIDWSTVLSNSKMQIYRIVQEALQNSNKYSKAKKCCVFILKTNDKITIRIWDNGVGFNPDKSKQGIGFKNITERTKMLNGTFKVTSAIGKGTTLEVVF